jgi:hypothetical protein
MNNGIPMNPIFQQIMQFGSQFRGDPKAEAMKLIKEGRFSQQQLDYFQNMARQAEQVLGSFSNIKR